MGLTGTILIGTVNLIIPNPLTSAIYASALGDTLGLETLGESGMIRNKKTGKRLNRESRSIQFVEDLSIAGSLPWMLMYGPLSMPYSWYYAVKTTGSGIHYAIYYKSRVESGEFDELKPI